MLGVGSGWETTSLEATLPQLHPDEKGSIAPVLPGMPPDDDSGAFTPQQLKFYKKNGFLVVRKVVEPRALQLYRERFDDICKGSVDRATGMVVMKDVALINTQTLPPEMCVNKLQDFMNDEILFSYCEHPKILRFISSLLGPDLMAMHTMLINKPPDPGTKTSRHPLHQDLYYFPFRPANAIACSWTAMEPVHRDNGCLVVYPKSHKMSLLSHGYPEWDGMVNKAYHGILEEIPEDMEKVYLEMGPGDTVFFHPLLLHGSGANITKGFRKAISCHYASSHCHYISVAGTHQQKIADEVLEIVRKKFGPDVEVKFSDVWNIKGRLVHGERVSL